MNAEITKAKKRTEDLYLSIDSLRKTLTLQGTDVDRTDFLKSLEQAYAGVQAVLSRENDRLVKIARSLSFSG